MRFESRGGAPIGEIDERCISVTNEAPKATADLWKPDAQTWELIEKHSVGKPATVTIGKGGVVLFE